MVSHPSISVHFLRITAHIPHAQQVCVQMAEQISGATKFDHITIKPYSDLSEITCAPLLSYIWKGRSWVCVAQEGHIA